MSEVDVAERVERRTGGFPRLGRGTRRAVLTVHVVAAGAWIGIDVVLGVLVFTAMGTSSTRTEALCYQALELFAVWPLFTAGMVSLLSGIVLGLGSNYGLVKPESTDRRRLVRGRYPRKVPSDQGEWRLRHLPRTPSRRAPSRCDHRTASTRSR